MGAAKKAGEGLAVVAGREVTEAERREWGWRKRLHKPIELLAPPQTDTGGGRGWRDDMSEYLHGNFKSTLIIWDHLPQRLVACLAFNMAANVVAISLVKAIHFINSFHSRTTV